jgi:hypothetical protein
MQGQNKAITVKSDQVATFRGMVRTEALRLGNVNPDAVENRVVENTISSSTP